MKVIWTSFWICLSSICISCRSLRSRAPSGSSSSSTAGWLTSARARATRCCWPPGELPGPPALVAGQPHELERLADLPRLVGLRCLLLAEAVTHVAGDVHVREQGVVLEHGVDVAVVRRHPRDRLAGEEDLARGGLLEARDHPQRGGLAAARGAEERVELAALDREVHGVNRGDVAEPLGHLVDPDVGDVRCATGRGSSGVGDRQEGSSGACVGRVAGGRRADGSRIVRTTNGFASTRIGQLPVRSSSVPASGTPEFAPAPGPHRPVRRGACGRYP